MWGFFFVVPRAVSNAVSFYRLTIRCVGCSTTFLIVSASACWYDVTSTSSVFQPPAAAVAAQRSGDWARYGEALSQLGEVLRQLQAVFGGRQP